MAKSIQNYTTSIAVTKTVGEIQEALAAGGARAVMNEYDDEGIVESVAFQLRVKGSLVSFQLPANIDGVQEVLKSSGLQPRYQTREQAARVGWRIVKDWVTAQIAMVQSGNAQMAQVFLPYAQNPETGETLYESFEKDPQRLLT